MRERVVAAIVITIALFDVMIGVRLLFFSAPELAHGADTLWAHAPELVRGQDGEALLASLLSRLGAFSLHAGIATLAWCWLAIRDRRVMSVLLVTYLLTGIPFFAGDARYFAGTPYFLVKQALGALWLIAVLLHFSNELRARPSRTLDRPPC